MSPSLIRNLGVAAVLGLIAGIGLVILREQLDNTVKENDEVEEIADAAVVLAQSGQRVALVEGDLRRPRVTKYLDIVGGTGLTTSWPEPPPWRMSCSRWATEN